MNQPKPLPTTRIWDLPTRLLHWLLAAAVGASAATGFIAGITAVAWHLIAGAIVSAAILARVVWGLLGPPYARFTGFALPPGPPCSPIYAPSSTARITATAAIIRSAP